MAQPEPQTTQQAAAAEKDKDDTRLKGVEEKNARSTKAASKVFTGSKWDTRQRKKESKSQTNLGLGGILDSFNSLNDPAAVAIFDARERAEEALAEERAQRMERARKAEICAAMDVEQVPSRLRKKMKAQAVALKAPPPGAQSHPH